MSLPRIPHPWLLTDVGYEGQITLTERAPALIHTVILGTVLQCSVFRAQCLVLRCQRQMSLGNSSILSVAEAENLK